jgi:hypothetical protein
LIVAKLILTACSLFYHRVPKHYTPGMAEILKSEQGRWNNAHGVQHESKKLELSRCLFQSFQPAPQLAVVDRQHISSGFWHLDCWIQYGIAVTTGN